MKIVSLIRKISIIFVVMVPVILMILPLGLTQRRKEMLFSTWYGLETDKCASIWLIKRFIDPTAEIRFFPKGENIIEGIPFDIPDAKLRRYHNMATFESLLKEYRIEDPALIYIGKIIHDIEINVWERKAMRETLSVQITVVDIITNSSSRDETIMKCMDFFDALYKEISGKRY